MLITFRNPRIVTEGSELFCSDSCLKGKEAHNYIKEVVKAGKVEISMYNKVFSISI